MMIAALLIVLLFAFLAISLRPRNSVGPDASGEVLDALTLASRYRPMLRLLDGSDFDLLNDADDPKLMRRIRSQRRAIFRSYLRGLRRDHARLCAQVRNIIVNSATDRKDLASALYRKELTFQALMFSVNLRLMLHSAGLGSVTAAPLMNCFEQVRRQAEMLSGSSAVALTA